MRMPAPSLRSSRRSLLLACAVAAAFAGSACQLEKFAPETVANGVARLSVRNAGAVLSLLNKDERCGFVSQSVLDAGVIEGKKGEEGRVTYTVTDCELDLVQPRTVATDCHGTETVIVADRFKVSGTQVIEGTVTGDTKNPIVPHRPDAVSFDLHVEGDRVKVTASNSPAFLRMVKGSFDFKATPMLAVSRSKGVCAAPTTNVKFSDLRYHNAKLYVDSGDRRFDVDVPRSNVSAQAGKWADKENALEGELTVWDDTIRFPSEDDHDGLDPDYETNHYAQSYECDEDLVVPVRYACPELKDVVSTGAGQLSVAAFARSIFVFDTDTRCGFASQGVINKVTTQGQVGMAGGEATFTVSSPCVVEWVDPTVTETDCNGVPTLMKGRVSMTGTKKIRGILTGDPREPVVPTSREPAEVDVQLTFDNYELSGSVGKNKLRIQHGKIAGKLVPSLAIDKANGACSLKTPMAEFVGLKHNNSKLTVESDGLAFDVEVATSNISAQSGSREGRTNEIGGTITVDGELKTLPAGNVSAELDPDYRYDTFMSSFTCKPELKVPSSVAECSFTRVLAENAARLLVQTAGFVVSATNSDKFCGFSNPLKLLNPEVVTGSSGQRGSMEWRVDDCDKIENGTIQFSQDCSGGRQLISGHALRVDAVRKVTGMRERAFWVARSIAPMGHDAVTFELLDTEFENYSTWYIPPGASEPVGRLVLHEGRMSGIVKPRLAERASAPGTFDVETPVATFENIQVRDVRATLESQGKRFSLTIPEATLRAQNGPYGGKANVLSGKLTLMKPNGIGEVFSFDDLVLNPDYTEDAFNATYACVEDLKGIVDPR